MRGQSFAVSVPGGHLGVWQTGEGVPVLLLHGGPGLEFGYVDGLADDIGSGYAIAAFQQRGLAPSMTDGPYDIDTHLADVEAVLDHLGWDRALIVGHSWGGHLALHVAASLSERVRGVLCVDPLGGVGDGGAAGFAAELKARTPDENWVRSEELEQGLAEGRGTPEDAIESLRLIWPAYFADWRAPAPIPMATAISVAASAGGFASLVERLPALEASLSDISVPTGFVAGALSPMPVDASSQATANRISAAWVDVVEAAGHFPWIERPGCVRSAIDRLMAG